MTRPLKDVGNEGSQGKLGAFAKDSCQGSAMALVTRTVGQGVVASDVLVLPNTAKAIAILEAYAVAGTSGTGQLAVVARGATLITGQCNITPTGDIAFFTTDAITLAEVTYVTVEGALITEIITVAASVGPLLANKAAKLLIAAEVLTGVVPGAVVVDYRGVTPATTEVAIDDEGTGIVFNAAQVIAGTATVTYIATPAVGTAKNSIGNLLDAEVEY